MNDKNPPHNFDAMACPTPVFSHSKIISGHGGGGRLTRQLIENVFKPAFTNPDLDTAHDGAVLDIGSGRLVMTTDSYVVQPLFFPGGDIGSLAVYGTVNDLSMCGARPLYLSASFILEEGLPVKTLQAVAESMKEAASKSGVHIVTGDTKVVETGSGDGLFITTTGVGRMETKDRIHPTAIKPGDQILLSGDLARHGLAVLGARNALGFDMVIESDCAPLMRPAMALIEAGLEVHCMRDLTRGGLATALVELAQSSGTGFDIQESLVPVNDEVRGACELLGFDPFYVANEGRFVCIVSEESATRALSILQQDPLAKEARLIGCVESTPEGTVTLKTSIGSKRRLDLLSGEQLPRIC